MPFLLTAGALLDVGRSLREAFFMFWETLWPIALGFGLSGAIQAFVGRQSIERKLGNHGPAAIARATGFGMAASSCSYAATATAKSLFVKGADYIAAMVFMFASTNLVLELGLVLIVLMGWQFAASEFIGGTVMIILLATAGSLWLRGRLVVQARERLTAHTVHQPDGSEEEAGGTGASEPSSPGIRTLAGWADAATYSVSDLTMLRRELVVGYGVAGFLAVLVPNSVWQSLFLHGHGFWTTVENAVIGPFIALISFVCSIGNVPLAAALWKGGISFGGVISFLFADLITLPLLVIYRRYYGTRLMLRMLAMFWVLMSVAGLITQGLFDFAHLTPTVRPSLIAADHFSWNYTTFLNIACLIVVVGAVWLYRNRERFGGGIGYATDPVCGMQVARSTAPASVEYQDSRVYFCSDRCARRFSLDSEQLMRT